MIIWEAMDSEILAEYQRKYNLTGNHLGWFPTDDAVWVEMMTLTNGL